MLIWNPSASSMRTPPMPSTTSCLSLHDVEPAGDPNLTTFDLHGDLGGEQMRVPLRAPSIRVLDLPALRIELLAKIPEATHERDADHWNIEVRGRAQHVAREHAEPTAVSADRRLERNFHREVADASLFQELRQRIGIGHGRMLQTPLRSSHW